MSLKLNDRVIEFLTGDPEKRFTPRQIAEWVLKTYPDECQEKADRSENQSLAKADSIEERNKVMIGMIAAEISRRRKDMQKKEPKIKTIKDPKYKYYYTEKTEEVEIDEVEADASAASTPEKDIARLSEHDLYPMLSSFLWAEYGIYPKRIDEKRSSNTYGKDGNKWLHPDLVAMEDLTADWDSQVKDCTNQYSDKKTKLWSFEVKLLINRSNVRQAFFQAVSNSSWANYGYLVATQLEGADTEKELRILSALHGIGFVVLDPENPAESQVLMPARERADIDWDTVNRLVEVNPVFKDFIELITDFYKTGKAKRADWDIEED